MPTTDKLHNTRCRTRLWDMGRRHKMFTSLSTHKLFWFLVNMKKQHADHWNITAHWCTISYTAQTDMSLCPWRWSSQPELSDIQNIKTLGIQIRENLHDCLINSLIQIVLIQPSYRYHIQRESPWLQDS